MPFDTIRGQDAAVATMSRALRSGRIHHGYRFEGPDGVGKEMTALAVAQALVCTSGDPLGCGRCSACRRTVTWASPDLHAPQHPDVVVIERDLYPPQTLGRSRPEIQDISVDQVRTLIVAKGSFGPHEGRSRVFLVRRAEELSTSAANALLKTLEEPPRDTYFILLTANGNRLLDTIRSRTQLVRFAPLPDAIVREVVAARVGGELDAAALDLIVELAGGSCSAALLLADSTASQAREAFRRAVQEAVDAPALDAAIRLSDGQDRDKDALKADLLALAAAYARAARNDPGGRATGLRAARSYDAVARALRHLDRNASIGLTLVTLVSDLRAVA